MTSEDLKINIQDVRDNFNIRKDALKKLDATLPESIEYLNYSTERLLAKITQLLECDQSIRCGWNSISANGAKAADYLFLKFGTAAEKRRVRSQSTDDATEFCDSIPG